MHKTFSQTSLNSERTVGHFMITFTHGIQEHENDPSYDPVSPTEM